MERRNHSIAQAPRVQPTPRQGETSLIDLILIVWEKRLLIAIITGAFIILSVILAFVLPAYYESSTTVLPITADQNSALSQYAGLAALAGINLPGGGSSTPVQKIVAILKSRTLCERVVSDLKLVPMILDHPEKITDRDPFAAAVEQFQKNYLDVNKDDKTNVIEITATFRNPAMAQKIANYSVEVLGSILNEKNLTVSKASIKMLEQQIAEQEKKVSDLQTQMARFQKDTKIITAEGQVTSAMTLYASLLQQKIGLEVNLSRLESALSPENSQILTVRAQLDAVNDQIKRIESSTGVGSISMGKAPEQIVEYQNIYRDLDIATKIYAGLLATYQNQKLQEAQDQLFIEVIDPAPLPEIRAKPKRKIIVVVGAISGAAIGLLAAFGVNAFRAIRDEINAKMT